MLRNSIHSITTAAEYSYFNCFTSINEIIERNIFLYFRQQTDSELAHFSSQHIKIAHEGRLYYHQININAIFVNDTAAISFDEFNKNPNQIIA